jgi:hypothetical protein
VNYTERKLSAAVIGSVLLASNFVTASAQQSIGTAGISGTITAALRLSATRGWTEGYRLSSARAEVEAGASNAIQVAVSGNGAQASQLMVPLEIRTNVAYELRISVINTEGCAPAITTSISSARPSGRLVRPAAVDGSVAMNEVGLASLQSAARLLAGPRVSLAGDYSSPNNALVANLVINVPAGSSCPWRTTLLVSLHQAGQ